MCVCVSGCVDYYSCSVINEVQVRASSNKCGFAKIMLVLELWLVLLTLKGIAVSSDSCVAKSVDIA